MHVEGYSYDLNGNLATFTDRRGKVTSLEYDALNREVFAGFGTQTSGGVSIYESTVTSTYDAGTECGCGAVSGRLKQLTDSMSGTIVYSFDDFDRIASEATPNGTVSYTYDAAGRRSTMTAPGQSTTSYTYDSANRLVQIARGSDSVEMVYDADGRVTYLTLPNSVTTQYSYDASSRVTGIAYMRAGNLLGSLGYQYDPIGRRATMSGTLAQAVLPLVMSTAEYNGDNRQTAMGGQSFTYDEDGNITSDGINIYSWDSRGRLVSMSGPALTATFQYDAVGRRISKDINGTTTGFLYDVDNVIQEQVGGAMSANILAGLEPDQFFTRSDASGTWAFLADGLGSTIALTDSTGAPVTLYSYDPFGTTQISGAVSSNTAQYTSRENDGTGLYYYRERYYSPSLQRFISQDPVGSLAVGNLYVYVDDSPTNLIDPSGLLPRPVPAVRQRRRRCNNDELEECERICGSRGVESCFRSQTFRIKRIRGGLGDMYYVNGPLSCSCREPECDRKKQPVPLKGPTQLEQELQEQSARYREQFWHWVLVTDYLIGVVGTAGALGGAGVGAGAGVRLIPVPVP